MQKVYLFDVRLCACMYLCIVYEWYATPNNQP